MTERRLTEREALQKALRALYEIDKLAAYEDGSFVGDISEITGSVIGDLARGGHETDDTEETT